MAMDAAQVMVEKDTTAATAASEQPAGGTGAVLPDSQAQPQAQPQQHQESQPDPASQKGKDHPMRRIYLEKVVLNMGMGRSGEAINIAKSALEQITGGHKPSPRNARDSQRDWGVRKGEPIGAAVTIRGHDASELLKRLLDARGNTVRGRSFDEFGNYSFGIREHIDIPGVKYDPQIGILGLGVTVSLARPGYSIRKRSKHRASIGRTHAITSVEAQRFMSENFGVQVE